MRYRLTLSVLLGLAIAAGVALPAVEACGRQTNCCCPHQQTTPACAVRCADSYTGVARLEASPFRLTRAPLAKSLRSLSAVPRLYTPPPVIRFRTRHAQDSPHAGAPPKRYLLSCALRL
jgi:hypothetical protein